MLLLVAFAFIANRQLAAAAAAGTALVPDERLSVRNLAELLVGGIQSITVGVLGEAGHRYVPLFGSFFIFILIGNLMGLVPGFAPPTSDFNVTFGLGVASFLAYNAIGIRANGLVEYSSISSDRSGGSRYSWSRWSSSTTSSVRSLSLCVCSAT
jgi:F-type H+-transporting ATPase subunit a